MAPAADYADELHAFLDTGLDYLARWDMPAACLITENDPQSAISEVADLLDQRGIAFDAGVEPPMYSHVLAEVDAVPNPTQLLRKSRSHGCTIILIGDARDYATATRERWAVSLFIDGRPDAGRPKVHAPSSLAGVPFAEHRDKG